MFQYALENISRIAFMALLNKIKLEIEAENINRIFKKLSTLS